MQSFVSRLTRHHAERWRRWGHLGMYGLLRIYIPYAWGAAVLLGFVIQAISVF